MQDLRTLFNMRAASWDQKAEYNTEHVKTMLMLSDLQPKSQILDVGCGTGFLEPYLLKYDPTRILAVDFAEKMIEIARKKVTDSRVQFLRDDIFHVPREEICCDYCFLYAVFPYFAEPRRIIRHICALMKPGSRIVICHPQGKHSIAADYEAALPILPASGLVKLLRPYFRLDTIIDNNVMFLVSGRMLIPKN